MARYTCAVGAIIFLSLAASLYLPGARGHGPEVPAVLDGARPQRLPPAAKERSARTAMAVAGRAISPVVRAGGPSTSVTKARGTHRSTVAASVWRTPPVSAEQDAGYRIATVPIAPEQIRRQLADGAVKALYDVALPLDLSEVLAEPQDEMVLSDPLDSGLCLTAPETLSGMTGAFLETAARPELADGRGESVNKSAAESSLSAATPTAPPLSIEREVAAPQAAISEENHRPLVEPAEPLVAEPDPVTHRVDWQRDRELAAVSEQVDALLDRAFSLAEKGALYSARAEFLQALSVVSQALDARFGLACYTRALNDGLVALREAQDFADGGSLLSAEADVVAVIARHRTRVCKPQAAVLTGVAAMQRYFAYAEERFTIACGGSPAASRACYGLGKVYLALAEQSPMEKLNGPQAMVFHQIATSIDPANYRAANELGVLLARFGQLPEARAVLQQSVATHPLPETWHNLMVVHQRLGEQDLAQRARNELALAQRPPGAGSPNVGVSAQPAVQWVDPPTFAQSAGYDPQSTPPGMASAQRTAADASRVWTR